MQSFLLLSSDEKATQTYIEELIKREQISPFDRTYVKQEEEAKKKKAAKKSIGIESIKTIQQDIYLIPVQGSKRLVVIYDAQLLTTEAQNALLKLLEEPPAHLILILVTDKTNALLPTILSRCFLINLVDKTQSHASLSDDERVLLENLSTKTIFELAEKKGKTKEETVVWCSGLIDQLEQELHQQSNNVTIQQYSNLLKKLLKIHQTISNTNISPRMTIESILLNNN